MLSGVLLWCWSRHWSRPGLVVGLVVSGVIRWLCYGMRF